MSEGDFYGLASVVVAFFGGAAVLAPILALSARFALKPVTEAWLRLRQEQASDQEKILQDRRISLLEAELQSVQQLLQQRADVQEFERDLAAPRVGPPGALPPA